MVIKVHTLIANYTYNCGLYDTETYKSKDEEERWMNR